MIQGKLLAGDFLILGSAMGAILGRLQAVATSTSNIKTRSSRPGGCTKCCMAQPTVPEKPTPSRCRRAGAVRFENVTFGYDPAKPVLHDISFDVKGGSVVAIVGPTGAGKTTLVNLIARFYDPQQGRILIDGIDLRDLDSAACARRWRSCFRKPISSATPSPPTSPTAGRTSAAATSKPPRGWRRRTSSSRNCPRATKPCSASAAHPSPAASAAPGHRPGDPHQSAHSGSRRCHRRVDPETEDLIRRGMQFVMHGRTTFIIAHRISTVKQADLVLVIEHGRITQIGTHEQLMRRRRPLPRNRRRPVYRRRRADGRSSHGPRPDAETACAGATRGRPPSIRCRAWRCDLRREQDLTSRRLRRQRRTADRAADRVTMKSCAIGPIDRDAAAPHCSTCSRRSRSCTCSGITLGIVQIVLDMLSPKFMQWIIDFGDRYVASATRRPQPMLAATRMPGIIV